MKKLLRLKGMLFLVAMLLGGVNAWAYTPTLTAAHEVAGYKVKAYYDISNTNVNNMCPAEGELRFRGTGYGLYNYGSGNRGADVALSVSAGDLLLAEFKDTQARDVTINSISGCTLNENFTSGDILAFNVNADATSLNINVGRAGCIIAFLVMEKDASAATAEYTINYLLNGAGDPVKTTTGEMAVGSTVATEALFFVGDVKYYRADGQPESVTIGADNNVFDINVRLANTYGYSVVSSLGGTIATGSILEGETVSVPYRKYVNVDGTLYNAPQGGNAGYYLTSFVPTTDGYIHTINYTATDKTNVVYFSEGEEIEGMTTDTGSNANIRCSNGAGGYAAEPVKATTLQPGKYKVTAAVWGNAGATIVIRAGETIQLSVETKGYIEEGTSEEFELTKATDITIEGAVAGKPLDYIYIVKTGEYDDPLAEQKADLQAAIEEAEQIDLTGYTDESAQNLTDAIEAAKAALENEDVTEEELNTAKTTLQTAQENLQEKSEEPEGPITGTFFSATVTANAAVEFANGTTEITADWATIVGGKMKAVSEQTDPKNLINKQGSTYYFSMTNNNTYFTVELDHALAVGDVISATIYAEPDATDKPGNRGVQITLADGGTMTTTPLLLAPAQDPKGAVPDCKYTVTEGDGLVGASHIKLTRYTANTTYFGDFTITRPETSGEDPEDPEEPGDEVETVILSWNEKPTLSNLTTEDMTSTGTADNVATWTKESGDYIIMIMNSGKAQSSAQAIKIDGKSYTTIKGSNGAQNKLILPEGKVTKKITLYSYVNTDAATDRPAYWKEVAGQTYTEADVFESYKDYANPDKREYTFEATNEVTFTNAGEQTCYVMYVEVEDAPEAPAETVGTYTMTVLPTTITGEKTAEQVEIEVEVKKAGEDYWMESAAEIFKGLKMPFTYNEATKKAQFGQTYVGKTTDEALAETPYLWGAAFVFSGSLSMTEPQPQYAVDFDAETGFVFGNEDAGLAWFVSDSETEFNPWDVYSAFYVVEPKEEIFGDASIEGEWEITTDWHYNGESSLGEQTDTYTATLDGNTVTFESQYGEKFVAKFTAENELTFDVVAVGEPATYTMTQAPFTDGTNVTNVDEDADKFVFASFTATYNPEKSTITFPAGVGLAFGPANAEGEFSYYQDAFDFVKAKKAGVEEDVTDALREELQGLVNQALAALDSETYTEESLAGLTEPLEDAQGLLANTNATAEELQDAIDALKAALEGLEKKSYIAWVYTAGYGAYEYAYATDPIVQALQEEYNVLEVSIDGDTNPTANEELNSTLLNADVVVVCEAMTGNKTMSNSLVNYVGQVPVIALKAYNYNSGRWSWGTPANPSPAALSFTTNATYKVLEGVTYEEDGISIKVATETASNAIQTVTFGEGAPADMVIMGTVGDGAAMYASNEQKFFGLGLSSDCWSHYTENPGIIIKNAVSMLIAGDDLTANDGIVTGINTLKSQFENGAVYNLQGQKVMKAQKGLYIINGKKVVVK